MYYLISLLIIFLIYILIDFLYIYCDCICDQLKIISKRIGKNQY